MKEFQYTVKDACGIHARPAGLLVKVAKGFASTATRYKGKTVEKWTALIPAASSGETSRYGVLLVYRKKAVGAYLLEKPSGTVIGLKDAQTAMAQAEQQDAQQVSGEDYSGDWGERHDEELGAAGQSQQTSGEPDSVVPEEAQYTDLPLDAEGYPVE